MQFFCFETSFFPFNDFFRCGHDVCICLCSSTICTPPVKFQNYHDDVSRFGFKSARFSPRFSPKT